jgi:hypothetical protein
MLYYVKNKLVDLLMINVEIVGCIRFTHWSDDVGTAG